MYLESVAASPAQADFLTLSGLRVSQPPTPACGFDPGKLEPREAGRKVVPAGRWVPEKQGRCCHTARFLLDFLSVKSPLLSWCGQDGESHQCLPRVPPGMGKMSLQERIC